MLVAADAERRRIERDLHDGVQQQLVALSVNLQLADGLMSADPAGASMLLQEIRRDVKQALDDTKQLALRIYGSRTANRRDSAHRADGPSNPSRSGFAPQALPTTSASPSTS